MQDIRQILHVKIESPYWDEAYATALAQPEIPKWLTEEYLRWLQADREVLPKQIDHIVAAAKAVSQVKELVLLAKTLANILVYKDPQTGAYVVRPSKEAFPEFEIPKAPEGTEDTLAYDSVCIFPLIAHLEETYDVLAARGIDRDVVIKTTAYFDGSLAYNAHLSISKSHFLLYPAYIYRKELYIERLRFEPRAQSPYSIRVYANENDELVIFMDNVRIHRSGHVLGAYGFADEEGSYLAEVLEDGDFYEGHAVCQETYLVESHTTKLPKGQWRLVHKKGDAIVRVHIAPGPGLTKENCEHAYMRAKDIFKRCYPEYDFKGFTTYTWMLSPGLIPVLKEGGNLYHFREKYTKFPACSEAIDVFLYVYHMTVKTPAEVDFTLLSDDNSMRRGVKEQLLKGNYIQESGGFFLM